MRLTDIDLTKEIYDKIKELPEDKVREVIDFIEFLKSKKGNGAKRGLPEAILKHIGVWRFDKGELDSLLEEIQNLRDVED
ncbi:MAG: hypothetical protein A2042_08460 [Candidatus Schekmanbacteria bacterium GWA2_38_11]|uniref:DUF2281 domain-containing protein n=1 Tax=Candidatus Schekmanbacteria bacterium GWA2_38_11 TaxID=1817876 RepID=A0A1F7RA54_9BACT|nr:MAG: hypothetical protein A2042_08460 [Candidatus Schekmanbacteria bacterium GWA2_38_11]